jgi:hypothetical protein
MTTNSDLGGSDLYDLTIHVSCVPLNNVEYHDEHDLLYEAQADPLSILGKTSVPELCIYILRIVNHLGNAEKQDREV